jgi:hypothetical protein
LFEQIAPRNDVYGECAPPKRGNPGKRAVPITVDRPPVASAALGISAAQGAIVGRGVDSATAADGSLDGPMDKRPHIARKRAKALETSSSSVSENEDVGEPDKPMKPKPKPLVEGRAHTTYRKFTGAIPMGKNAGGAGKKVTRRSEAREEGGRQAQGGGYGLRARNGAIDYRADSRVDDDGNPVHDSGEVIGD